MFSVHKYIVIPVIPIIISEVFTYSLNCASYQFETPFKQCYAVYDYYIQSTVYVH